MAYHRDGQCHRRGMRRAVRRAASGCIRESPAHRASGGAPPPARRARAPKYVHISTVELLPFYCPFHRR